MRQLIKRLFFVLLSWFFFGCTTTPTSVTLPSPDVETTTTAPVARSGKTSESRPIDLLGLKRALRLERPIDNLGYAEKSFHTCDVGYGYSSSHDCQTQYFIIIQFRLQCRSTEETVNAVSKDDLYAINSNRVKWSLGRIQGVTQTDTEGYGQIQLIAPASLRQQKLRLTISPDFLVMTAEEITRVVVPHDWCQNR